LQFEFTAIASENSSTKWTCSYIESSTVGILHVRRQITLTPRDRGLLQAVFRRAAFDANGR
jgi:hypothetical protein